MNRQILTEIKRINKIMGNNLLIEQATLLKGLRQLFGIADDTTKAALKFDDIKNLTIFKKSKAFTDDALTNLNLKIPKKYKGVEGMREYFAVTINKLINGKTLTPAQGKLLYQLALNDKAIRKVVTTEFEVIAKTMGKKLWEILEDPNLTATFQKMISSPRQLNFPQAERLWSEIIKEAGFWNKKIMKRTPKSILADGGFKKWWSKLVGTADTVDEARDVVLRNIVLKEIKKTGGTGTYWEVWEAIFNLVDVNSANKLLSDTAFKNLNDFTSSLLTSLEKGIPLGEQQLQALQKILMDNPNLRKSVYEGLANTEVVKNYLRDNQKRWLKMKATEVQAEKIVFFDELIMNVNPKVKTKTEQFMTNLQTSINPFKVVPKLFDIASIRWGMTRMFDMFFNFGMYPKFQKYYWIMMSTTGLVNWLAMNIPQFTLIPKGEKPSVAGLKPDFYVDVAGSKNFVQREGGLNDTQAEQIANLLHAQLNGFLEGWSDSMSEIYVAYRKENLPNTVLWPKTLRDAMNKKKISAKFMEYLANLPEDSTDVGVLTTLLGVNDENVQSIYLNMIPTVLASSQVTYFYDDVITKKDGQLNQDLNKLDPLFFVIPIPIIHRTFTEGKDEINKILDNKRWIKSVTDAEEPISGIVTAAWDEWPKFPDSLCSENGCTKKTGGQELICRFSGAIPPDHLSIMVDGDDSRSASSAQPPYPEGSDIQEWLKSLTIESFNKAYLQASGSKVQPYGLTVEEVKVTKRQIIQTKSQFVGSMSDLFNDISKNWDKLQDPNNAEQAEKILGPKLFNIFQLMQQGANDGFENTEK